MSVYKIFPEADATLYSAYPTQNTGLDEILEISVKNASSVSGEDIRRAIIRFSDNDLYKIYQLKNIGDYDFDVFLRLYLANAENLSTQFYIEVAKIDTEWSMGVGKFADNPITNKGVSWYNTGSYTSSVNNWPNPHYYITPGGGSWINGASGYPITYKSSKDINFNITNIFNSWITYGNNNGFLLKHEDDTESNPNSEIVLNYFGVDTHTIYPPCLEMRWNDSTYSTGSLSVISNTNTELSLVNNPYNIKSTTDKYTFRIAARDKYPVRTFSTSSIYLVNKALPETSYWAIQDVKTEDMIVDFDSDYTKISCDSTGSFFNVYMSGLEPERYYKVLVKYVLDSGESVVIDNNSIFKIVR